MGCGKQPVYVRTGEVGLRDQSTEALGIPAFRELHVPGRIRGNHVIRAIAMLGLEGRLLRVLDAGSGRGDLAIALAEEHPNWQVTGVDLARSVRNMLLRRLSVWG